MTVTGQHRYAFPLSRSCPFAPPPEYREIREEHGVAKVDLPFGGWAWVVSRHEDVRRVLADRRFSSNRLHPDFPVIAPGELSGEKSMIMMDPPEHAHARRAVLGDFTVRRVDMLRPRIQQIIDEHVTALLAGPKSVDLVRALALPVPSLVICDILGVPYADQDFFQRNSAKFLLRETPPQERVAAFGAISSYLDELIGTKETNPDEQLLSRQIQRRRADGGYRRESLVAEALLLLVAGHETTANMITLGTLALLENPDQLARIVADPAKTPGAVEELLRYLTIVDIAVTRLCVEDAEIGGVTIRAGEGVLVLGHAANRDPAAFDNPDDLNLERGARHHVAFGYGPHQCLGQNLARAELEIVFDTLFRQIPTLQLAKPVTDETLKNDAAVFGLHELVVTW